MSYLYVPDMEASDSGLESQCQLLAPSVSWRGKLRAAPLWLRGCKRDLWLRHLFGQTSQPLTASLGVERWISSLRASRANLGASLENRQGLRTSATLAKSSSVSLARWDQATSSWRTSQGLFDAEPPTYLGDFPKSGSMRSGAFFQQAESGQLTEDNAAFCLPTGKAWPTPNARDHKGSPNPENRDRMTGQLDEAAERLFHLAPTETGAKPQKPSTQRLNPKFVEWLMGLPDGWTSSGCSATELCRYKRLMRSILYTGESHDE